MLGRGIGVCPFNFEGIKSEDALKRLKASNFNRFLAQLQFYSFILFPLKYFL